MKKNHRERRLASARWAFAFEKSVPVGGVEVCPVAVFCVGCARSNFEEEEYDRVPKGAARVPGIGFWYIVLQVLPYHMCEQNALFLDVSSELFGLSSRGIKL